MSSPAVLRPHDPPTPTAASPPASTSADASPSAADKPPNADGPPSPAPSSPRLPLASTVSTMWSGLMRTFSADSTTFPTHDTGPSSTATSMFELPPLDPVALRGYRENTPSRCRLLSSALAEEIRTLIPERMKLIDDWNLIYGLTQDGSSLGTMYSRARRYSGTRAGFVMVVQDSAGSIFGAYLSEYPHPAPSYFGNGECFLWRATTIRDLPTQSSLPPPPSSDTTHLTARSTTLSAPDSDADGSPSRLRFKAFPYSGLNDFFMNCEASFFSVGAGGGHYGLWLDSSLLKGHSARSETFGNEPLSDKGESFHVINVELWAIGK